MDDLIRDLLREVSRVTDAETIENIMANTQDAAVHIYAAVRSEDFNRWVTEEYVPLVRAKFSEDTLPTAIRNACRAGGGPQTVDREFVNKLREAVANMEQRIRLSPEAIRNMRRLYRRMTELDRNRQARG